jgi:methylated-DNA-[protein]-cysteine S-methyltransferase
VLVVERLLLAEPYLPCWTWAIYDGSPFGQGLVLCRDGQVARVWLPVDEPSFGVLKLEMQLRGLSAQEGGLAAKRARQLEGAFRDGVDLSDLEIFFSPELSPFTRLALKACLQIPRGTTCSYGALARQVGSPRGARALGNVMAGNALPLIIPCHRVITASGALGGFLGGGEMKRWLLEKEGVSLHLL